MGKQENMYDIGSSIHYNLQLVTEQGEWMKNKKFEENDLVWANRTVWMRPKVHEKRIVCQSFKMIK